ncbi:MULTISPECIES: hypothetical protein [Flavonifractor]|uniref:hypothetical protein n=1 Tax=Flavonifractor TaxID=946234 RepID=UPI0004B1D749|nr:hypothetical protein [Flavonifractor plautii]MCB5780764.1 hypothetical protein [Flavonifractor plautii]UOX46371.1 hypothetical protein K5I25_01990 [Flavonifractor plautii]
MLKEQKLTEKELRGYRQWLSELDEESRGEQGTSRQAMDPDLWRIFDPKGNIGRQIYESYTDEALLEAVVVTMDHPGHKPRTYQLSPIRQVYLKQRFGNINKACWAARGFRKRLEEQKRWPPDWPERVSADGFRAYCERIGSPLTEQDAELAEHMCRSVRESWRPPEEEEIPPELKMLFQKKRCSNKKAMELMGIPVLSKLAMKHLWSYWLSAWGKPAGPSEEKAEGDSSYEEMETARIRICACPVPDHRPVDGSTGGRIQRDLERCGAGYRRIYVPHRTGSAGRVYRR